MVKYRTKKNLEKVYEHIDNCMSEWYLAMELIADMNMLDDEEDLRGLSETINRVDITKIGAIKQKLEDMIEEKK